MLVLRMHAIHNDILHTFVCNLLCFEINLSTVFSLNLLVIVYIDTALQLSLSIIFMF